MMCEYCAGSFSACSKGFGGVIVRHVEHGGTSPTGYPGARAPAPLTRKTWRMLGWTRTLWRVALVRVNSLYPGCRRTCGTPTTRYVVGATVYDRGNIRGSACRDDHVQTYCIYAQAGWKTQERDADSFRLALATRTSCLLYTSPSPRDGLLSRMPSSA